MVIAFVSSSFKEQNLIPGCQVSVNSYSWIYKKATDFWLPRQQCLAMLPVDDTNINFFYWVHFTIVWTDSMANDSTIKVLMNNEDNTSFKLLVWKLS